MCAIGATVYVLLHLAKGLEAKWAVLGKMQRGRVHTINRDRGDTDFVGKSAKTKLCAVRGLG